ncbi:hypothetical protein [Planococcus soli]|uniref:hypothetical protein n=1 Tax=Planococcus soli TaxID=2666072 RepID=UPI00115F1F3F|nr:hypothetical protein [Planococcus soli]
MQTRTTCRKDAHEKVLWFLAWRVIIWRMLALWWMSYDSVRYSQFNVAGEDEVIVREMDFDFVFYATLLAEAAAVGMYAI